MKKDNKVIETKEFWEQVKKEYKPTLSFSFICITSDTFNKFWKGGYKEDILKLGLEFLTYKCIEEPYKTIGGYDCLFYSDSIEEIISMRKEFIDWCINKFN